MENKRNKKSAFSVEQRFIEGASELSPSLYNVLIGVMLTWGFGVNYLMCRFAAPSILSMFYSSSNGSWMLIGFFVAYFACVFIGSSMMRSESIAMDFIGYNLIVLPVGVLLTVCVAGYDPYIVTRAAMATACITLIMMMISAIKPDAFMRIGSALLAALIAVIIVELIGTIFFRFGNNTVIDYIVVAIFGLYIGFDWARAGIVQRTPTNAILVSASLYMDIINIFIRILSIMGKNKD